MGLRRVVRGALPGGDGAVRWRCGSCDREFAFAPEVQEPSCPYCEADVGSAR